MITGKLSFINEAYAPKIPTYSVFNHLREPYENHLHDLKISSFLLVDMYKKMVSLNVMDSILYECQRQGRISFYMTNFGEEAIQIGSAAALRSDDIIFAQYREAGVLLWRGFSFQEFIDQCYGNSKDLNKGRQMPVHYGSSKLNFVTISSPLTTQLPQAVGAAYGLNNLKDDFCAVCFFGEGAASEGDTHAAFNFAAVLKSPVLFICRNNGYAISTPRIQQYSGDGIAAKGPAYGINTIRVNGNDVIAVYKAIEYARSYVVKEKKPALVEAMTYRLGHHSTSDDSTAYRTTEEIKSYNRIAPIIQLRIYLQKLNFWDEDKEKNFIKLTRLDILNAISTAEKNKAPTVEDLFSDVYNSTTKHLNEQMILMKQLALQYKKKTN